MQSMTPWYLNEDCPWWQQCWGNGRKAAVRWCRGYLGYGNDSRTRRERLPPFPPFVVPQVQIERLQND
jgi:hypothetical protein